MREHKCDQGTSGTYPRPVQLIVLQMGFPMSCGAVVLGIVLAVYSVVGANAQPVPNNAPTSVDWSKAQSVEIVMTNVSFTPRALQLRRNTPYRLHFVNNGSSDHSIDTPELFGAMMIAPDDREKIEHGTVEVAKGQTLDVMVVPFTPGSYAFHCSHFLHAAFGMRGEAIIQ